MKNLFIIMLFYSSLSYGMQALSKKEQQKLVELEKSIPLEEDNNGIRHVLLSDNDVNDQFYIDIELDKIDHQDDTTKLVNQEKNCGEWIQLKFLNLCKKIKKACLCCGAAFILGFARYGYAHAGHQEGFDL